MAPSVGSITVTPRCAQCRDVGLRRLVQPHPDIHRRGGEDRLVGRQEERGGKVVGDAGGHFRKQVGGRRADQDEVGGAAELDVAHLGLVLEVPQRGVDRAFGQRGEGHRRDEMSAAGGQDGRHLMAVAAGEADQFGGLERRDPAADDEQNFRHQINART